jgi:hypothetical protein
MLKHGFLYNIKKHKLLYLMFLPTAAFLLIFNYAPLWGLRMAFFNYIPWKGFEGSAYVGWQNFKTLFSLPDFSRLVTNTVVINVYKILIGFPMPILFALLLNEIRGKRFKRTVQTISYLPHFVSWVIVSAILYSLINGNYGLLNTFLSSIGIVPPKWYIRPDLPCHYRRWTYNRHNCSYWCPRNHRTYDHHRARERTAGYGRRHDSRTADRIRAGGYRNRNVPQNALIDRAPPHCHKPHHRTPTCHLLQGRIYARQGSEFAGLQKFGGLRVNGTFPVNIHPEGQETCSPESDPAEGNAIGAIVTEPLTGNRPIFPASA